MRTNQDIVFDVTGQTLYFDAPEGRPSSIVSVDVYSYSAADDSPVLSGTGAVETYPNTTVDDGSGASIADPNLINVTATTGMEVGRSYLITGAGGKREWFDVAEVNSGATVIARHPLHNMYIAGDAVQSTRLTITIDPDWVADPNNLDNSSGPNPSYRVRWVYVIDGTTTHVADTYFSLVRYAGQHGVRPADVESTHVGWLDRLPVDHRVDQGRRLIDEAYRAVKLDLHGEWTDDAMVANAEIVDELTRYKAIELTEYARALGVGGDARPYEIARLAFQNRFDKLVRIVNNVPVRDHTGGASASVSLGLTRR